MIQLFFSVNVLRRSFHYYTPESPVGLVDGWQQHTREKQSAPALSQKILQNEKDIVNSFIVSNLEEKLQELTCMKEVELFKFTKAFYYGTASTVAQRKRQNHYIPKGRHSVSTRGCSEIIAVITILMSAFYTLPKDLYITHSITLPVTPQQFQAPSMT